MSLVIRTHCLSWYCSLMCRATARITSYNVCYTKLLRNYGLITNVGKAHLEGFGSFDGVKVAKGEMYSYLKKANRIIFINSGNEHLNEMAT